MILPLLDDLARVTAATTPAQYALATPCEGFDVRRVRQHLTGGLAYFDTAFRSPGAENRGPDPHGYAGPDQLESVLPRLSSALRSALDEGVEDKLVNVPHLGGTFPGTAVLNMLLIEVITHGWDMAIATGLPWEPDEAACDRALAFYRASVKPEWRGPDMPFAYEFPVSPDAPTMDRIAAFAGRDPGWQPR
ncbi:TIGR03086 family metal-binding protein [Streptomyces sp. NPDC049916]|uniref:TIGR03086 family metal-binding protein n=1 Tax=Streptomyces sp. NPDC049916 TaxID=3155156 RepID=UPI00343F6B71